MIYIDNLAKLNFFDILERDNAFDIFINTRFYTVKDSSLTYRQANSMDEDNMLPPSPDRNQGWRKFSFKEILYIETILELKKFGLQHSQLRNVWNCFFKDKDENDIDKILPYVMAFIEIVLTVTPEGNLDFYSPNNFPIKRPKDSFVFISFTKIFSDLFVKFGGEGIIPNWTLDKVLYALNDEEIKALEIIRNKDYKSLKISKKDGSINIIHAEQGSTANNLTDSQVLDLLSNRAYASLTITKRDGKIVNVSTEDTYKV